MEEARGGALRGRSELPSVVCAVAAQFYHRFLLVLYMLIIFYIAWGARRTSRTGTGVALFRAG